MSASSCAAIRPGRGPGRLHDLRRDGDGRLELGCAGRAEAGPPGPAGELRGPLPRCRPRAVPPDPPRRPRVGPGSTAAGARHRRDLPARDASEPAITSTRACRRSSMPCSTSTGRGLLSRWSAPPFGKEARYRRRSPRASEGCSDGVRPRRPERTIPEDDRVLGGCLTGDRRRKERVEKRGRSWSTTSPALFSWSCC